MNGNWVPVLIVAIVMIVCMRPELLVTSVVDAACGGSKPLTNLRRDS